MTISEGTCDFMSRNQIVVPEAANALDRFKFEVAADLGIDLKPGYNGDMTARDAGRIGGQMVKRMIAAAEASLARQNQQQP